jgi:hypothetical protein
VTSAALACALALLALASAARAQEVTLVPFGSTWRYLDEGPAPPAPGWRLGAFDDSLWPQGAAELGFGDGGEATVLTPDVPTRVTYYFRHTFDLASAGFQSARVRLRRDDGAVVYLNGVEVGRSKIGPGAVGDGTFALRNLGVPEEDYLIDLDFPPALLQVGANVLAVEVHQGELQGVDAAFDLELLAGPDPRVVRGPYLQRGAPGAIVVRFSTSVPVAGRVRHGASPGSLDQIVDGPVAEDHEIPLSGLSPGTLSYYSVGSTAATLAGGDAQHFFRTSPPVGAKTPKRIWVVGDSGDANQAVRDVLADYLAFTGTDETDAWLMLGDNAYDAGTKGEYDQAVFDVFQALLRNTVLWPTIGNHESGVSNAVAQTGPYFELFTLPTAAQSGGLASGTEAYYSFDHGNVHFLVLDSQGNSRLPQDPMLTWAAADLAQTQQDWVIAYWHHPPYSKGSHDSDNPADSGGRLRDMRENALPILEAAGVDLVLTGHSHSYERSMLVDGHYDVSGTFNTAHQVDTGDGCVCAGPCPECPLGGNGPYVKPTQGPTSHEGTVYGVVGNSSLPGIVVLDPNWMMVRALSGWGAMAIDVAGSRLEAHFLERGGVVRDRFTILKGGDDDADLSPNPDDNCRYEANASQTDTGRLLVPVPDGIGDACQCGDVAHGGVIEASDAQALRNHLASVAGAIDAAGLAKCAVAQAQPACDLLGLVVLRRALAGSALPGIAQVCTAALP